MASVPLPITRNRSHSDGYRSLKAFAENEKEPEPALPVDAANLMAPMLSQEGESNQSKADRRQNEDFNFCTSQGISFPDTQFQKCQSRLDGLVELATNSSSSEGNIKLAKKALRYRKVLELRRIIE